MAASGFHSTWLIDSCLKKKDKYLGKRPRTTLLSIFCQFVNSTSTLDLMNCSKTHQSF